MQSEIPKLAFPEAFEREAKALEEALGGRVPAYLVRRLLLDVGGYTEERLGLAGRVALARQRLAEAGCPVPAVEARSRYGWIRQVTAGCVERPAQRPVTWTDRLDRLLTHRVWGTLAFLALMFVVFQSIFTLAAPLMDAINAGKGALGGWLARTLGPGMLSSLLVDGVVGGVGGVVVFLPQILILFGFIAVLEDCGYMARAAFLMDRLMARAGLSGKSFIPLLSSMACAVPGIMATRVIENRRDRLATILVAPLMSCSARLPVYVLLISAFLTAGHPVWLPGLVMFAMYALGLVVAPLVAFALKRTLLRGETPVFVMEMPTYKWPSAKLVLRRMLESGWYFLARAGTLILASMIVVWALLYFPDRDADGQKYDERIEAIKAPVQDELDELEELEEKLAPELDEIKHLKRKEKRAEGEKKEALRRQREEIEAKIEPSTKRMEELGKATEEAREKENGVKEEWKRNSLLGRAGRALEPAFAPLGWDWRLTVAALASFPAREVVVGTLGIIYKVGEADPGEIKESDADEVAGSDLGRALAAAKWDDSGRPVFTVPTALSVMVFFALCCQCASTLAVIKRETRSWRWPLFTFTYMTVLAYLGALVTYQVGTHFFS